jgi:hypothetical protein
MEKNKLTQIGIICILASIVITLIGTYFGQRLILITEKAKKCHICGKTIQ